MSTAPAKLAVLTSGGDFAGMNAAVRAIIDGDGSLAGSDHPAGAMVGMRDGRIEPNPLQDLSDLVDGRIRRPRAPGWWMALRPLADVLASVER